jgi:hypothetical protein
MGPLTLTLSRRERGLDLFLRRPFYAQATT